METYAVLALVVACVSMGTSEIIHPCESNLNYDCLREFFGEHAECSVRSESVTSSTFEGNLPMYLSNINATVVTTKTTLSKYDGQVETFFVDTDTKNVVIAVRLFELFCDAPDTLVAVKQLGREPKVVSEHIKATYPEMLITAVIPMGDKMNINSLRTATIRPYFENSNAIFDIGPKFSASKDSDIAASFNRLLQDVPTALLEIGHTKGSYAFFTFLQKCICDFGANPNIQHQFDTTVFTNIEANGNDDSCLVEPCSGSKDMRLCVGNYLAKRGLCTLVNKASDGPVSRALFRQYIPGLNVTAIVMDSEVSGLNGEIKSFYVNQKTNNYVLATEYKDIRMSSPAAILVFHRKGDQPITVTDYRRDLYPNVVLTTVVPAGVFTPEVILNQAHSSAYFLAEDAVYDFGVVYTENKDPQVMEVMRQVEVNPMLVTREIFETDPIIKLVIFVQKALCEDPPKYLCQSQSQRCLLLS